MWTLIGFSLVIPASIYMIARGYGLVISLIWLGSILLAIGMV